MEHYAKRKEWQLKTMSNELLMISNQARFYELVTEGKLTGSLPPATILFLLKTGRLCLSPNPMGILHTHTHTHHTDEQTPSDQPKEGSLAGQAAGAELYSSQFG